MHTNVPPGAPSNLGYDSETETDASALKVLSEKTKSEVQNIKSAKYNRVEVLLLSWTNPYIPTQRLVDDLKQVFKDGFGYHATMEYLDPTTSQSLEVHVNARVGTFVKNHNGPHTLLIVYYVDNSEQGGFYSLVLRGLVGQCDS